MLFPRGALLMVALPAVGCDWACSRPLQVQVAASRYRTAFQSQTSQRSHDPGVGTVSLERDVTVRCSEVAAALRVVSGSRLMSPYQETVTTPEPDRTPS